MVPTFRGVDIRHALLLPTRPQALGKARYSSKEGRTGGYLLPAFVCSDSAARLTDTTSMFNRSRKRVVYGYRPEQRLTLASTNCSLSWSGNAKLFQRRLECRDDNGSSFARVKAPVQNFNFPRLARTYRFRQNWYGRWNRRCPRLPSEFGMAGDSMQIPNSNRACLRSSRTRWSMSFDLSAATDIVDLRRHGDNFVEQ